MSNCRQCQTDQTRLSRAEDDVLRIARILARTTLPSKIGHWREQLAIAKADRTEARRLVDQGHECNTLASDEHWSKRRA